MAQTMIQCIDKRIESERVFFSWVNVVVLISFFFKKKEGFSSLCEAGDCLAMTWHGQIV